MPSDRKDIIEQTFPTNQKQEESDESKPKDSIVRPNIFLINLGKVAKGFIKGSIVVGTSYAIFLFITAAWFLLIVITIAPAFKAYDFYKAPNQASEAQEQLIGKSAYEVASKHYNLKSVHANWIVFIKTNINVSSVLKVVDHLLITLTIFLVAYLLLDVIKEIRVGKGTDALQGAIAGIDKSVLSLTTITLSITFLIYFLKDDSDNVGLELLYRGLSISGVILAISAYLFLVHRHNSGATHKDKDKDKDSKTL